MMETAKIVLVDTEDGDWSGMYIDGRLASEGHSLYVPEVIKLLAETGKRIELGGSIELTYEEIEEHGCRLPKLLSDL